MITKRQDWYKINTVLKADPKAKLTQFLSPAELNLMWQELPIIFASIKAVKENGKYSATKTLQGIPDLLSTPKGNFDKKNLSWLIATIGTFSRSVLGVRQQTKSTNISALVPIFLAAQRTYNKISYNDWNREDKSLKILLGKSLEEILDYQDFNPDKEDILAARETMNVLEPVKRRTVIGENNFKAYSSVATIALQAWVANVQFRNADMILDLKDWDIMPEALDATINVASDMPW